MSIPRSSKLFWLSLAVIAVAAIALIVTLRGHSPAPASAASAPPVTWAAGVRRAPAFTLADPNGAPVSLAALRGRPVIITFIDPVCRNLCPFEARVLSTAVRALPASERPAIVSVSVNPWEDTKPNFAADATHWSLAPEWRWAIGSHAALATVWHDYAIAWADAPKHYAGVTEHKIIHTEASYVIDGSGYERALFLYPFKAKAVEKAIKQVS